MGPGQSLAPAQKALPGGPAERRGLARSGRWRRSRQDRFAARTRQRILDESRLAKDRLYRYLRSSAAKTIGSLGSRELSCKGHINREQVIVLAFAIPLGWITSR